MSNLKLNECPKCKRTTLKPKPSSDKILLVNCLSCEVQFDNIKWNLDENIPNRSIMTATMRNAGDQRYNLGYSES